MKMRVIAFVLFAIASGFGMNAWAQEGENQAGNEKPQVNTKQETPVKIIEYIPGTWVIQSVYRGKDDVTATDTLANIETIEFNREGRYVSYSGTEKIDSGAYRLNEQHSILYMASENDEEKPMEWNVSFKKDGTMTMTSRQGSEQMENINYVYRRRDQETSSNRKNQN